MIPGITLKQELYKCLKLKGYPFPLFFYADFHFIDAGMPIKELLKLFLSSKEGNEFKEVFGEPIFSDENMVVYNVFNQRIP